MNNIFNVDKLLKLVQEVTLIKEASFSTDELSRNKYFFPIVDRIKAREPFLLEPPSPGQEPQPFVVDIDSPEGQQFLSDLIATNADKEKLDLLFKEKKGYKSVIPSDEKDNNGNPVFYALNAVSKSVMTAKITKGGLQGTETPDMKEGLVAFFFLAGPDGWTIAEQKLTAKDEEEKSKRLDLPSQIIDAQHFGAKSASLVQNAIIYLNENTVTDKKEIRLFLNAISAAKASRKYNKNIVDRGQLFEMIRKAATKITKLDPDKWCPGDIYIYDAGAEQQIVDVLKKAVANELVVTPVPADNPDAIGINSLFGGENPLIYALSLKEEIALSGRATAFLKIRNIKGTELAASQFAINSEETQILKLYKDKSIPNVDALIQKYEAEYQSNKAEFISTLGNKEYGIGKIVNAASKRQSAAKSLEYQLGYLVSKSTCFRFMTSYLQDFDNLKNANDVMKQYKNPMVALTAFGVSLSGFNPTFLKIVASSTGEEATVTVFEGQDSLTMSSEAVTVTDTPTKAGFNFSFVTKMGEKDYQTTLDIRFAGGVTVSIIVEEFHEGTSVVKDSDSQEEPKVKKPKEKKVKVNKAKEPAPSDPYADAETEFMEE